MKLLASFSGGKDAMLSVDRALADGHEILGLITTIKDESSWFHDLPLDLLESMADALDFAFYPIQVRGGDGYKEDYAQQLKKISQASGAQGILFGDIDLEDHRLWCESLAAEAGVQAIFPLWGEERRALVEEFLHKGYKSIIKKVDKKKLGKEFLGKQLDEEILGQIEALGHDACGENGEYHTAVIGGPRFQRDIQVATGPISENEWTYTIELFEKKR